MSEQNLHGGCMCGAVRYQTNGGPERITVCHCLWCQQRTGTAFGTELVFMQENVVFTGESASYRHVSDDSGRWLEVHFCSQCGSNLGLTLELRPDIRSIPAGTLADADWIDQAPATIRHVYTRSQRHWGELSEDTEAFAAYFT